MELKKVGNIEFTEGGVCAAKGFRQTEYSADLLMQALLLLKKRTTSRLSFLIPNVPPLRSTPPIRSRAHLYS